MIPGGPFNIAVAVRVHLAPPKKLAYNPHGQGKLFGSVARNNK